MTTYVRHMTHDVTQLKAHSLKQATNTREQILDALNQLGNPQPHEIKEYLDRKKEKIEHDERERTLDYNEKHRSVKVHRITLRTIHRWLRTLSKQGLLEHIDSRYSLSEKYMSDIRYSGQLFATIATTQMSMSFPKHLSMNHRIKELLALFGFMLIYLFIEAARPIQNDMMNNKQKADLIVSWVENSIPTRGMFFDFLRLTAEKNTQYELNQETIDKLTKILQKLYPVWYKRILEERARFSKALVEWDRMKGYKQ
jgi:Fe2+ or Zn2+ uptake regulation protein